MPFLRHAPPPPAPAVVLMPVDPAIAAADLRALRGLDQKHPVLGPVLRLLVETRAAMCAEAERAPDAAQAARHAASAHGVSCAVAALVAATRGELGRGPGARRTSFTPPGGVAEGAR